MSQVIINDVPPYTQAFAIAGQTIFGTTWTANFASDVVVYVTPSGSPPDDLTQILSYPSQYSVDFIGDLLQVQVTLVTPSNAGDVVTVTRMTPADRENLYTNTNFLPSMLNNDFGILTLVDQQAKLANTLISPHYNYSAVIAPDFANPTENTIIPILAANQFWAKNAANTAIEAVNMSDIIGGLTEVDTGLGLTGGPITSTGTISFAPMNSNSFWGNITGVTALPSMVPTSYFLISSNNLSDLPDKAQARINIGLQIGVNVEAWSAALDSIAALTTSANEILYLTGPSTYSVIAAAANSVLVTNGSSVPALGNTLPIAVQSNITQLGAQSQALNMNSHQIHNVTDPSSPQDAATRAYVLAQTSGTFLPLTGGTMSGAINMGNNQINAMADPSSSQDATTKNYVDTQLGFKLSKSGGTMTGSINMGSNSITSLLDPVNPQDAATKNYVDLVATGLTIQPAVFAASTTALTVTYNNGSSGIGATLTNASTQAVFALDGTSPAVNARVLIKDQAATLQNGIYTVTNVGSIITNWVLTRATDYDQPSEIQPGDLVIVNNGTTNGGASFIETDSVGAVGTDPIQFSQFTFSATDVLLKANNLMDVANPTMSFNNISPLTTKGDLIGFSTQNVRLAVGGTNGQILQVLSSAATGLAYSTATYPATTTVNQILFSNATNTIVGLSTLNGGVLVTDASGVPQFLTNPSVAGKVLQSANAAIPTWSTPTYPSGSGAAGKIMISDGTNNIYSTPTYPNAATTGKILIGDGTNIVLSTPSYPNASAASRTIIVSNGTNYVASTETYAVPGSSGNVMTSDGTNWTSAPPASGGTVTSITAGAGLSGGVITTSGTIALIAANTIITSMTGLTGVLQAPTSVNDSNGNIVLGFSKVASAVNYLNVQNAATGTGPTLTATGSDSTVTLALSSKGGNFQFYDSTGTTAARIALTNAALTHTITLQAGALTTNPVFTLPIADGTNNQFLQTNGSGVLSFASFTVKYQTITATGAFTYTPSTGCFEAVFELQAGGAGSGGGTGSSGVGIRTGGASGGNYLKLLVTGATNLANIAGSVGIAGTGGASGNHIGNVGGNTTLTINSGTQWVATGGQPSAGGAGSGSATGVAGAVATTSTTGTNGTLIVDSRGGTGGDSCLNATVTNPSITGRGGAPGGIGAYYGRGGDGAFANGANTAGVTGIQGIVIITEYCIA